MKKLLFLLCLVAAVFTAEAQIKITEMVTYSGNPDGGWVPVVISGTNRKVDAALIGRDSIATAAGSTYDTLKLYHNGVFQYYKLVRAGSPAAWGGISGTLSSQTDLQSALNAKVATSRTITINGTTFDLSADRSFTVGTVTQAQLDDSTAAVRAAIPVNQVNPGTYIAPDDSFNPGFLVIASAIVRPSSTYSHGTPIVWEILDNATSHNSSFIDSAYGNGGTGQLTLRYPTVKNVLNLTVTSDESFAGQMIFQGPTVGTTTANVSVYRPSPPVSVRLTGAGTTTWTKSNTYGSTSNWDVTTYNTADGTTSFNVTATTATEYSAINIQYIGPNGYSIKRFYSGLGAYNVKFALIDAFGNAVTSAPTSSDEIVITGAGTLAQQVNMATYTQSVTSWLSGIYNFWVTGLFEVYMVAAPKSSTTSQVRWQAYPAATAYKIYRSTTLYGTKTLVYNGTNLQYDDSGLTANTKYFYHMYAVLSGVDTFITSFTTNTYQ